MTPVFADTSYWIAIGSGSDDLHAVALKIAIRIGARPILTSEMVLTELLDGAADMGIYQRVTAAQTVSDIITQGKVQVVPMTHELFDKALALYRARPDKAWSLTDCASFVICEQEGITEVLTYDHHFQQAGLIALLRDTA